MQENCRVVWKEGLFLQPQHFQQADRYMQNLVTMRFGYHFPHPFGFEKCEANNEKVANGEFLLTSCSGVMPDGTPFDLPRKGILPPMRPLQDVFGHDRQSLMVYLALPLSTEGRSNVADGRNGSRSSTRFMSRTVTVTDEVFGEQRKEIEIAENNFCILFEGESLDNFTNMPVARLLRNTSGMIELDDSFVPPLIHIGTSLPLMNQIRSLLEVLLAKSAALGQGRKQHAGGFAEFKASEETAYRLLLTINTYTPLLNHFHTASRIHPYELYTMLVQFAGALCTFSNEVSIQQIPHYEHAAPGQSLRGLFKMIRTVLNADISAGCVTVPITRTANATYVSTVSDPKLFNEAQFYLGVAASMREKELVIGTLQRIKMCSQEKLELIIPSAMPGLTIYHSARPPEGLSTKPGFVYFSLDQKGEFWEGIRQTGSFGIYFPNNFPDLKMEILALKR